MPDEPRIRDLYRQYSEGRIPFEEVVRAADRVLEQYAAERAPSPSAESRPRAAAEPPRD